MNVLVEHTLERQNSIVNRNRLRDKETEGQVYTRYLFISANTCGVPDSFGWNENKQIFIITVIIVYWPVMNKKTQQSTRNEAHSGGT